MRITIRYLSSISPLLSLHHSICYPSFSRSLCLPPLLYLFFVSFFPLSPSLPVSLSLLSISVSLSLPFSISAFFPFSLSPPPSPSLFLHLLPLLFFSTSLPFSINQLSPFPPLSPIPLTHTNLYPLLIRYIF